MKVSDRLDEKFLLWGNKDEKKPEITIKDAYEGVIKAFKTLKTTVGHVYNAGKEFFAVKKANDPKVAVYQDARRVGRETPHILPFERIKEYFDFVGMRGLARTAGKFQFECDYKNQFDLEHKMGTSTKNVASKRRYAPKRNKKGEMKIEEKIEGFLQGKDKPKKGAFHKWLGKSENSPITDADIKKGLASKDPHVRKMANFAKNAKKWKH